MATDPAQTQSFSFSMPYCASAAISSGLVTHTLNTGKKKIGAVAVFCIVCFATMAACVMEGAGAPDSCKDVATAPCNPLASVTSVVVDETYNQLRRSFLPGRGRPPAPPDVPLTNRTLLQLAALKLEGRRTSKDVERWFQTLFPEVSYPSSRLSGAMDRLGKKAEQKSGADLIAYLDTEIDFDFVSASLLKLGLKRGHLLHEKKWTIPSHCTGEMIINENVIDIELFRTKEKLQESFTVSWIKTLSKKHSGAEDSLVKKSVKQTVECYRTLTRKKDYGTMLTTFLATPFETVDRLQNQPADLNVSVTPAEIQILKQDLKKMSKEKSRLQELVRTLTEENSTLKQVNRELYTENMNIQQRLCDAEKLTADYEELDRQVKTQRPAIKRMNKLDSKLKDARAGLKDAQTRLTRMEDLKKTAEELKRSAEVKLSKLKQTVIKLEERNEAMKQLVDNLNEELLAYENEAMPQTKTGEKNRYSDTVRQTVIELQCDGSVAADKCDTVIRSVARNLFSVELGKLPCASSALNMADEGHFLTKVQAAEKILDSTNCTIHSDGTSRNGNKIIGFQVTLDSGENISLGFTTVAAENAVTLLEVTVKLLEEIQEAYTPDICSQEEKEEVFKSLLSKITSTMTDRAAVMKLYDAKLEEYLKSQLGEQVKVHFLHCNAHCLLGFSRACELALKATEEDIINETGTKLGRDKDGRFSRFHSAENATSRVIRTASDIFGPRGDEKNGCRGDWVAYCTDIGKKSFITSYRSNRFNSFFSWSCSSGPSQNRYTRVFNSGQLGSPQYEDGQCCQRRGR